MEDEPTFEELRAKAQATWLERCAEREARLKKMSLEYDKSPDVTMRPDPSQEWSHPDITCLSCGGAKFYVPQWVTINGVKTKALLVCAFCKTNNVWDWTIHKWELPL